MLAQCYLANGEGQKVGHHGNLITPCLLLDVTSLPVFLCQALRCFQEAATEVEKEEFLMKLTGSEDEDAAATPRLQYYSKVGTGD